MGIWIAEKSSPLPGVETITHEGHYVLCTASQVEQDVDKFPNANNQSKFSNDKIKGILKFSLPTSWREHMTLTRFQNSFEIFNRDSG